MKENKTKDFICADKDPRCGKIRMNTLGCGVVEICHLPPKKIRNKKCVVLRLDDIKEFLFSDKK